MPGICRYKGKKSATASAVVRQLRRIQSGLEAPREAEARNAMAGDGDSRPGGSGEFVASPFYSGVRLETENICFKRVHFSRVVKILQKLVGLALNSAVGRERGSNINNNDESAYLMPLDPQGHLSRFRPWRRVQIRRRPSRWRLREHIHRQQCERCDEVGGQCTRITTACCSRD
jgi:hypothetical protein